MTPLWWMLGGAAGSWFAISATIGDRVNPELLYGLLGPLASAAASWVAVVRTHASSPERLTQVMTAAFALKMVFFAVYVIAMLVGLDARPVPFAMSFTGYFIALYAMQAAFLRRLLQAPAPAGREPSAD